MIFRQRKTFGFSGTVTAAIGLLKNKVIGKPVLGTITVTGNKEDFDSPINRVFKVSGEVTEAPQMTPGKDIKGEDYPYVVRHLGVTDTISSSSGEAAINLVIVPWKKLDNIVVRIEANGWLRRTMLNDIVVKGTAELLQSEDLPDVPKKR